MSETTFIYALKEPDTGEIRYIGKANEPNKRFVFHICNREKEKCHRANWISFLMGQNKKPVLEILDEVPVEHWQQWEVAWIEFFRGQGCNLVNNTPGGEGLGSGELHPSFGRPAPNKGKKTGKPAWNRGLSPSLETRKKQSESHVGKVLSLDTRRKMSQTHQGHIGYNKGFKMSSETREKMSVAQKLVRAKKKGKLWQEAV